MSLIKAIYNATVEGTKVEGNHIAVVLNYNNKLYTGFANCHSDDMDFFSRKVGYTIAKSRARIAILKDAKKALTEEVIWKRRIYKEVAETNFYNPAFDKQWNNLQSAERRLRALQFALKDEEANLRGYIDGQAKVFASIKRMRAQDKKD